MKKIIRYIYIGMSSYHSNNFNVIPSANMEGEREKARERGREGMREGERERESEREREKGIITK